MDLIQAKKKVEAKDKERNKLLGQKEMLMDGLKELGFKTIDEAKKTSKSLKKTVDKMNTHYDKGVSKFKTQFGHLLK